MYVPEDNLLFKKLGLTRSTSLTLSMTPKEFREKFRNKVEQADYLFNFFAIREKEYGGSIKASTFLILHGGSEIAGASGTFFEKNDKLDIKLTVYCHMIYVFLFFFITYLIGFIALYNFNSSEKLPLLIICAVSFLIFPALSLYSFIKKVKIAFIDFERTFLNL
jgi:hypothetical protein